MFMGLGNVLFDDSDFECINENDIQPRNNDGASFLLVYTLVLYGFSVVMFVVFYKVPEHYGLIIKDRQKLVIEGNRKSEITQDDLMG